MANRQADVDSDSQKITISTFGFMKVTGVLSAGEVNRLITQLGHVEGAGRRGVLSSPAVADLACSPNILGLARPSAGPRARPVRSIYFDKSASNNNWGVAWHQDLTIAVRSRADVAGFGPWSEKDGIPHVQAPARLLEQMITVRLHLDACDETNGALRVLSGSHKYGRVEGSDLIRLRGQCAEEVCNVSAGGALLMRPLLLHASGRSHSDGHRRVLHTEYAGFDLPEPLQWHEAD